MRSVFCRVWYRTDDTERVSEREMMERNEANARLQAVLASDPGFQACAVEFEPSQRLLVIEEPGRSLTAASAAAVAAARSYFPVAIVQGVTPTDELERARAAVLEALTRVQFPPDGTGVNVGNDWITGKVRITGPVSIGRAVIEQMLVGQDLVALEDNPGLRRLPGRPC
jgi:hypothetical protein